MHINEDPELRFGRVMTQIRTDKTNSKYGEVQFVVESALGLDLFAEGDESKS